MASRRNLKKGIKLISDFLVEDIMHVFTATKEPNLDIHEDLLTKVCELENETLAKVNKGPEQGVKARKYYYELIEAFNQRVSQIEDAIIAEISKLKEDNQ